MTDSLPHAPARVCAIFCKVVDNFGDIGICWRLARQLAEDFGWRITLWVDDLALAQRFAGQGHAHIALRQWPVEAAAEAVDYFDPVPQAVIETFGCGLPMAVQQAMQQQPCCWLNVDYLSAEPWVADFHGRPSPQANGLVRHFFYPGFTAETGGLLRERHWTHEASASGAQAPAIQTPDIQALGLTASSQHITVSLFCYPQAPLQAFWQSLLASPQPVRLWVPQVVMPGLVAATDVPLLAPGQRWQRGPLEVQVLPMLSQPGYDQLLAMCDLNLVRGEDSWIRALWAARPMIWQPYIQSEDTHVLKLKAFLQHYLADAPPALASLIEHGMLAWTQGTWQTTDWQAWVAQLPALKQHAQHFANRQAEQTDLATKLVIFIEKWWAHQV